MWKSCNILIVIILCMPFCMLETCEIINIYCQYKCFYQLGPPRSNHLVVYIQPKYVSTPFSKTDTPVENY